MLKIGIFGKLLGLSQNFSFEKAALDLVLTLRAAAAL
jgi:hypothetical protein